MLSKGTPGTLEAGPERRLPTAAENAVKGKKAASATAVKHHTGEILVAMAGFPAKGFSVATQGSLAPGSTFKIVTAALLIDRG